MKPLNGLRTWATESRASSLVVLLILLFVFFWVREPNFATVSNLRGVLSAVAVLWIVTIGVAFVMLAGGFDLSVGSTLALTGYVLAFALDDWNLPVGVAIAVTLLAGMGLGGLVNGLLIGKFKLSFLVVTLGTFSLFGGLTQVWAGQGGAKGVTSSFLEGLGFGRIFGVPNSVVIAIAATAIAWYVLRWTYFGRDVYAIGGNPEAARLAGINVSRVTIAVYAIGGLCAALATVAQVGLLGSASPIVGQNTMLQAATAALLGGIALGGGSGSVLGACVGVIFVGVLNNGLQVSGVIGAWQNVVLGTVLIAAVVMDTLRQRRAERSEARRSQSDTGSGIEPDATGYVMAEPGRETTMPEPAAAGPGTTERRAVWH